MTTGNLSAPGLVLLSGLPGSGKTTFARALAESLAADHYESDAIRFELAGKPTYASSESARVFAAIERRSAASLTASRVAIVDATNLTRRDRKRFLHLANAMGVPLIAVRLVAPDDVVRLRIEFPRQGFSEASPAIYAQMKPRVQAFTVPALVVDTRFSLEPSLSLVRRLLETTPSC